MESKLSNTLSNNSANLINDFSANFSKLLDKTDLSLKNALKNDYLNVSLKLFLVLYAALVAPKLPRALALMMDSTIIRVILATLIVYSSYRDPITALLLALIFIITLQTAQKIKLYDSSLSVTDGNNLTWLPSAKNGAVVGKELTNNVEDELRQKMMVKELLTNEKIEKDLNVANEIMDAEMIRRTKHDVIVNLPNTRVKPVPVTIVKKQREAPSYSLTNYTKLAGQSLIDVGSDVVSGGWSGVSNVASGTHKGVFRATDSVINTGVLLGSGIVNSSSNLGSGLTNSVGKVASGVSGGVRNTTNGVIDGVSQASNGLYMGAKDVKSGLVGGVSKLGDCLIDSAAEVTNGLLSGVKQLSNGLLTGAETAGSGTLDGIRTVGSGVRSGVSDLGSGAHGAAQHLNSAAMTGTYVLGSGVINSARDVGSGFHSGVVSVAKPFQLAEPFTNVPSSTSNISSECKFMPYVSNDQLEWANSNNVPGANQSSVVKTFDNQHSVQGLNTNWANPYTSGGYSNY